MSATTITGASANDSTSAVRDTAEGSKNRTIAGAIKGLFRKAAKAGTFRPAGTPRPKTRRRKGGEDTHAAFPKAWRATMTRTRPAFAAASIFMSATLDWLHLWQAGPGASGTEQGNAPNAVSNHLSPHP